MSAEWIKVRVDLANDPAVIAIAAELQMDEDAVVGKLVKLWSWADQHTTDGDARGVTPAWLERHVGVTGFAAAMASQGWLSIRSDGITFPNFDRHNGDSAKNRALTRDRNRTLRERRRETNEEAGLPAPRRKRDAACVTQASPEQEQEQEERKTGDRAGDAQKNGHPAANGVTSPGFQRFWFAWPPGHERKRDSAGCFKVWKAKGLEPLADGIVDAVEAARRSRDWTKNDGQFIPAPIVWLRSAGWEPFLEKQAAPRAQASSRTVTP
jgi:hypothetical protein